MNAHINESFHKDRRTERYGGLIMVFATHIVKKNAPDGNSTGKKAERKNMRVLSIKLSKTPGRNNANIKWRCQ